MRRQAWHSFSKSSSRHNLIYQQPRVYQDRYSAWSQVHWKTLKFPVSLHLESKRSCRAAVTAPDVVQSKGEGWMSSLQLHRQALPSTAQDKSVAHSGLTAVESSPRLAGCWTLSAFTTARCCALAKSRLRKHQLPDLTASTPSKSQEAESGLLGLLAPTFLLLNSCHKII